MDAIHYDLNAESYHLLFSCREEVLIEKAISRKLSAERKDSFEVRMSRFDDKASEHNKGPLSPTRRERSRTERVLEEGHSINETRPKMENVPSSRVSGCS